MQTTIQSPPAPDFIIAQPGEPIINITAFTARQKASGFVGGNVSHMMGGDEPALILAGGHLVWRVPIILTMPTKGVIGMVGEIDVDARTGQLRMPANFQQAISEKANALITSSTD
jgi:hypothetical protein